PGGARSWTGGAAKTKMTDRLVEFAVEISTFARLVSFNPYQGARFFQLQLCTLASSRAGFGRSAKRLSQLVNFNQTNPRPTTAALKNSGIVSGPAALL